MIHQIIRPRRRPLGRTEINAVFLAHVFDLLPAAREADDGGVELGEVAVQHGGGVARRVAGYEDGEEEGSWRGGGGSGWWGGGSGRDGGGGGGGRSRGDEIDHPRHLVEFFGADVGTVRESEIDLHPPTILVISKTIPSPPPPPKKKKNHPPDSPTRTPPSTPHS